jgi:hypothetical protein
VAIVTQVSLVDDLDGSKAAETVSFSLEGRQYEVDLSEKNARKLRDAVAPFVASARRSGRGGQRSAGRVRGRQSAVDRQKTPAIREWARGHGYTVADRGRIPANVMEAYEKAAN